ncbi:unnamed protein product [Paramecium octaurelia]|uniref:Uncharacterized protein n=1 Tax=Paramecium octaurelia TaxID=43137 RepID=A0A8S1YA26_PAROT|nr:unnamed protein product [Paramecium octaurelia]
MSRNLSAKILIQRVIKSRKFICQFLVVAAHNTSINSTIIFFDLSQSSKILTVYCLEMDYKCLWVLQNSISTTNIHQKKGIDQEALKSSYTRLTFFFVIGMHYDQIKYRVVEVVFYNLKRQTIQNLAYITFILKKENIK